MCGVNDVVIAAIEKEEAAWKAVLRARSEVAKERCMEIYKVEERKFERCIYQRKEMVNEQLGRKMNQDV